MYKNCLLYTSIPVKYVTPDGMALGVWLGSQRAAYKEGVLTDAQIEKLAALEAVSYTHLVRQVFHLQARPQLRGRERPAQGRALRDRSHR